MATIPAKTIKSAFSRQTSVSIDIRADPAIIWPLLVNAADYPRWNSTIVNINGRIAKGETIRLTAKLDPKRPFKLKIKEADINRQLVWGDAMGKRIFTLNPQPNGITHFSMSEKIGGPFFPLFAKMIPSFDEAFDRFAADLKKEAETIVKLNKHHMKTVQVTYTSSVVFADQNRRNIEQVMNDLQQAAHPGIFYHTCLDPNGKTFIHTAFFQSEEDEKTLFALASFQQFQQELKASGPEVPPKQVLLTYIGSSKNLFES